MSNRPLSLRHGFAWTAGGNVANGISQWAVLSAIAKLGSTEALGQYALAVAVAMPVALFAHLNLRALVATDVSASHPFADYARVRLGANAGALAVLAALSVFQGWTVLLVGASILVDNTVDLLYGLHQKRHRLDEVARSMTVRALVSVTTVALFMWMRPDALSAGAGLLTGRLLTLVAWDWPRAGLPHDAALNPLAVLKDAIPLGLTQMLIALSASLPRYAVERSGGPRELGAFAAVASFVTLGAVLVGSLGQSVLTRLAEHRRASNTRAFHWLTARIALIAVGLGVIAVACAWTIGGLALRIVYTPEYAPLDDLLVATLAAGSLNWIAQALGFATTSARAFRSQLFLLTATCLTIGAVSFAAVPPMGLYGAALAIAAGGAVGILGQLATLRWGL